MLDNLFIDPLTGQTINLFIDPLTGQTGQTNNSFFLGQLSEPIQSTFNYLKVFAADSELIRKMNLAFGHNWNVEAATTLVQNWLNADFSDLPKIEIRRSDEINNANGAYASATNTIYLSQEYITQNLGNSQAIVNVLLEEVGHYLDSQLNTIDAPGDEGAIFAALVQGINLDAEELLTLKAEDDTAAIALDGQEISIEKSDFNSDNQQDILWRNYATGENVVWFMNGTNIVGNTSLPQLPVNWRIEGTGNFNGDTQQDILWRNYATGENVVWFMNGTNIVGNASLPQLPVNWRIEGTGNFNGDTQEDLVWRNYSTGENVVWFMNGTNIVGNASLPQLPVNWHMGTDDFNGDSQQDILWRNYDTGENVVWFMNGTNIVGNASLPQLPVSWEPVIDNLSRGSVQVTPGDRSNPAGNGSSNFSPNASEGWENVVEVEDPVTGLDVWTFATQNFTATNGNPSVSLFISDDDIPADPEQAPLELPVESINLSITQGAFLFSTETYEFEEGAGLVSLPLTSSGGFTTATVFIRDNDNTTFASTDVPQPINDNSTITSSIEVDGLLAVTDVNLTLDITHTFNGDLDVSLISPAGTQVDLFQNVGSDGDNFTNTTLDDEAATAIFDGAAPFTGSFQPQGLLSNFDSEDPNGFWTLAITDNAGGDIGTLNSWSLNFTL